MVSSKSESEERRGLPRLGVGRSGIARLLMVFALIASSEAIAFARDGDRTEYVFTDEVVAGDLENPNGELLRVKRQARRQTLIRLRESFIDELAVSIDDL